MAQPILIERYLDELRKELRWSRSADAIIDEVADHLLEAVAQAISQGTDSDRAQQRILAEFGDPALVGAAFISADSRGIAMPSQSTRTAGTVARIAAALWVVAGLLFGAVDIWNGGGDWRFFYSTGAAALLAGSVLTGLALLGLRRRHGGLGTPAVVGLVLFALGVVATLGAWFIPGWMGLQGAGLLLIGVAVYRDGIAPRSATILLAVGHLAGLATFVVARLAEVGWRDSWGDYPVAAILGVGVGSLLVALGLFGLGTWLVGEEPADVGDEMAAA